MAKLSFAEQGGVTYVYNSKEELLGIICYDLSWRCLAWEQEAGIKMSYKCIEQVQEKIKDLSEKRGIPLK